MKTIVIHHSADFDGIFCREIARRFMPNAEFVGWDFGEPQICLDGFKGTVYVMDLPLDCMKCADECQVIWIDHHRSSIAKFPTSVLGYRIDGVSACRLAWVWFSAALRFIEQTVENPPNWKWFQENYAFPKLEDFRERKIEEPLAVRLAGEYDVFDQRDPRAELFQSGLRSQPLYEFWPKLLSLGNDSEYLVAHLLNQGACIYYARTQEYADVIKEQGFDLEFEGLKFLACCSHECDIRSQLFEAGIKPHHQALLGFTYTGKPGKEWRVSMYQLPGAKEPDLSVIAVKHGGGGHPGACGFIAHSLPWLEPKS